MERAAKVIVGGACALAALGGLAIVGAAARTPRSRLAVPVPEIAGRTEEQVAKVLGDPEACSAIKQGRKCSYRAGAVEVVLINGRADWITVRLPGWLFEPDAVSALGLQAEPASLRSDHVIRWDGLGGLREVSLHPDARGGIDYAYIKATTP